MRRPTQPGLYTVTAEKGADGVTTFPRRLIDAQQTAQVARLVDHDLGRDTLLAEGFAGGLHQTRYLTVCGRRSLLFWPQPVPVTVRFVDRTPICIRLKTLSCILAPPEEVKITTGSFKLIAFSINLVTFSPIADPIEPPIKAKSIIPRQTLLPDIVAVPVIIASFNPVFSFASLYLVT